MALYQNDSLNKIAERFPLIDLSSIEGEFVVPVGEICDKLGLKAEFKQLEEGHSGYFNSENKTIVINDNYPATRNLFTVAHEIGHYVLHEGTQNRFDQSHQYTPEELIREKEANNFAGELLMPKYKFETLFIDFSTTVRSFFHGEMRLNCV